MADATQDRPPERRIDLNEAFMQARGLQGAGRLPEAQRIYEQILLRVPHHAESMTLLASICYQRGQDLQGQAYLDRAIEVLGQALREMPNSQATQALLANLLLARGRQAEAETICATLQLQLNPIRATPETFVARRQQSLLAGLPPMLFNTLPKSASESIWNRLAEGLGMAQAHVSIGLFPDCCVLGPRAQALGQGGLIVKEHLPATPHNLAMLAQSGVRRVVFHVRDPRQATLSWAHFVRDDVSMRLMAPIWRRIVPHAEVLKRDLAAAIDWSIERYLPLLLEVIEGWMAVEAAGSHGIEVLFMDFEAFRRDEAAYLDRFLAFYGIARDKWQAGRSDDAEIVHLRRGEVDEWRRVFTPAQAAAAADRLPEAMVARFGWIR